MDEEKERSEAIANIRACLISVKGKVSLRQLETDYRVICGQRIPYSRLGFKTILDFISSIPSLTLTRTSTGEYFVDAQVSEKSVHITDMVSRQKNAKKKPPVRTPYKSVRFHKNISPPKNWNAITTKYKPKQYNTSARTAAVSHNQLISRSPVQPKPNISKPKPAANVEQPIYRRSISTPDSTQKTSPVKTPEPVSGVMLNTPMRANFTSPGLSTKPAGTAVPNNPSNRTSKSKMMSVDRDSENSSPTRDVKTVTEMLNGNPIEDLRSIVDWYKLGKIEVNHTVMQPKKKFAKALYNCKITVDGQTYLSYPEEFLDANSAEVFCAKKALDELLHKCARRRKLLLAMSKDIKERIPPMLKQHAQTVTEMLNGNPIEDLRSIVDWYKLGKIEVNHTVMQPKKKFAKALYNCKITVDGQTYLSYPEEFLDANSAEVFCAKKALDELLHKCARRRKSLLAMSKDIKERIPPMLKQHAQGIWSYRIEEDYAELYSEQLPSNWLEIIDSCDCVAVERIQDDKYVLRYCLPGMIILRNLYRIGLIITNFCFGKLYHQQSFFNNN